MGMFDKNVFSSKRQDYATPQKLFDILDAEFHFTLDVCADETNHKTEDYIDEKVNALEKDWYGICWMNPPYNNKKNWIIKAYKESVKNKCVVVCLIPARTNTSWWHDYCMKGEIRFIKGRPIFEGMIHGLPQPLAIVIFGENFQNNYKAIVIK
jgi:phage N-6-adenine-methyltransferase